MSKRIGITTKAEVFLSVEQLVAQMDEEDIGTFCSAVAERLDIKSIERASAAGSFADGISEQGARFLAEVVTSHYIRQRRGDV